MQNASFGEQEQAQRTAFEMKAKGFDNKKISEAVNYHIATIRRWFANPKLVSKHKSIIEASTTKPFSFFKEIIPATNSPRLATLSNLISQFKVIEVKGYQDEEFLEENPNSAIFQVNNLSCIRSVSQVDSPDVDREDCLYSSLAKHAMRGIDTIEANKVGVVDIVFTGKIVAPSKCTPKVWAAYVADAVALAMQVIEVLHQPGNKIKLRIHFLHSIVKAGEECISSTVRDLVKYKVRSLSNLIEFPEMIKPEADLIIKMEDYDILVKNQPVLSNNSRQQEYVSSLITNYMARSNKGPISHIVLGTGKKLMPPSFGHNFSRPGNLFWTGKDDEWSKPTQAMYLKIDGVFEVIQRDVNYTKKNWIEFLDYKEYGQE